MNRTVSVYLDVVRFGAAMVVLLGHLSGTRFTGGLLWQVGPFMGEAVAIFFVLSGFVISYALTQRDGTPAAYAASRVSRVLSVAIPALVLTFTLDAIGRSVAPGLYTAAWGYQPEGRALQVVANLLFVNQIWFLDIPPGSDLPYWSLGFEIWYYVIFGLVVFRRLGWAVLACLVAGPKILCMMPLWLIGVAAHRLGRGTRRLGGLWLWLGSVVAWGLLEAVFWRAGWPALITAGPFGKLELLRNYAAGLLFAAGVVGLQSAAAAWPAAMAMAIRTPVRWLAGATFSLYLFHLPIAQIITATSPWRPDSTAERLLVLGGTIGAAFLLAEITERRKEVWRHGLAMLHPAFAVAALPR